MTESNFFKWKLTTIYLQERKKGTPGEGSLMWMMPLHLHVNNDVVDDVDDVDDDDDDDDDDNDASKQVFLKKKAHQFWVFTVCYLNKV